MDKICRICLNSIINKKALSIYKNYDDDKEIYLKIKDLSGILIAQNDKSMPNSICAQCYENLNSSCQFRNLCLASDIHLKNDLVIVKNEPNIIADEYDSNSDSDFDYAEACKIEVDEKEIETVVDTTKKKLDQTKYNVKKSMFELIPGFKNRFLCKICGGKISVRRGHYNFNRHLGTNKHCSQLYIEKDSNNENSKTESRTEELYARNHQSGVGFHKTEEITKPRKTLPDKSEKCIDTATTTENNLSNLFEENSSTIGEKLETPIMRLTETAFESKSKRRNTYFNSKLEEEFKADFEPDENCKFNAFCKTCKRTISIKSSGRTDLLQHMNTYRHKGIKLIRLKSDNKTVDDMLLQDQLFICEICGNVFNKKYQLRRHLTSHNETFSFSCEICHKKFRQSAHIRRHMRVHTGEKPYQCSYCGRCFGDLSTKVKHERTHTDERPYPCNTCEKRFRIASTRNEHQRIHTGEKPFSCETCNVAFTKKCQLQTHYKSKTHQNLMLV